VVGGYFYVSFESAMVGGVNYTTHVVVNAATGVENCVSTCIHMVQHLD